MEFEPAGNNEKVKKDTYICENCGNTFANRATFNRHLKRKTPCKKISVVVNNEMVDKLFRGNAKQDLPKFDFEKMWKKLNDGGFSCIICAARGSGKTTLINYLYPKFNELFDIIFFFAATIHNGTYSFVDEPKFNKFNENVFVDIREFQQKTGNLLRVLVIMDDCVSNTFKDNDEIMQLFLTGRNYNISCIISSQASTLVNKKNRGNTDFVIIGKTNTPEDRTNLINSFLGNCVEIPKEIQTKVGKESYLDRFLGDNTLDHNFVILDYQNSEQRVNNYKVDK